MSEHETIHVLLARVLDEMPAIGKNQVNKQQGFRFRGIDDVLDVLNPLLGKHGVFFVPDVLERVSEERATKGGGVMNVVHLHVRYRFYGPKGDYVEASGWGEGTDSGDKATNKAMTGAMKYVLFQVFAIATEEQAQHDADRHSPEETVHEQPASTEDVAAILARFASIDDEEACRVAKVDFANTFGKPSDLTAAQIPHAHKWLDKRDIGSTGDATGLQKSSPSQGSVPGSSPVVEQPASNGGSDRSGGGGTSPPGGDTASATSELPSDDNRDVYRAPEENPPPKGPALAKEALERTRKAS